MQKKMVVGFIVTLSATALTAPNVRAQQPIAARTVKRATTKVSGGFYSPNRAPLQPTAFQKLPAGSIEPRGWLRQQLQLDANGLSGRLPEISDFLKYEGNGWVDPKSSTGWEELPYWLRGYGDLGYVLHDQKIIGVAKKWINGIMANQKPDGYFGPERLKTAENGKPDLWPHMLVLDALRSYYEYSHDERVPVFMAKYFGWQMALPNDSFKSGWGALRWADNMSVIYWLYNKNGDTKLLDLARRIHENSVDYTTGLPNMHNVNLAQGIREPAEFWLQGKEPRYLAATEQNYHRIMDVYGQFAGGGFAGDENIRTGYGDPRQGFETCGFVEYMHTFEIMSRLSGDPIWADRTEDIAFNSLPAALTADHKAIHYITSANSIQLDNKPKSGQFQNGFAMQAYKPGIHDYRCCPHNYGIGWPYYAQESWLATSDHGLCASLYGASLVKARVGQGKGTTISITQDTEYPFTDTISMRIAAPKSVRFPLYLRVPRWCAAAQVQVNGARVQTKAAPASYIVLDRTWKNGDLVKLRLPMQIALRKWSNNKDSVSVNYGPLTYALPVDARWSRMGGTDAWPEWEVFPTAAWNYGLQIDPQRPQNSLQVVRKPGPVASQPFTPATAPISIRARARRIPNWKADQDGVVTVLQQSPARTSAPLETVTLLPMGAARLRITSFPTVSNSAKAHNWIAPPPQARLSASHVNDVLQAVADGVVPSKSSNGDVPRFTWWDHKGTTEWVQRDFDKPTTINAVSVFWFDDTGKGECRVPQSWSVLYKDGTTWKPLSTTQTYGTAADTLNRVSFAPIKTTSLRIEAQLQMNFSGGILEWKIEPTPQFAK